MLRHQFPLTRAQPYELPEPDPAPLTTIAWRVCHVVAVNELYHDYAFGSASLTFDLEFPSTAGDAVAWLRKGQRALRAVLDTLGDADLDTPRRHNNGALWPAHRIVAAVIHEQVHHGAEISLLRDLFGNRDRLGRASFTA